MCYLKIALITISLALLQATLTEANAPKSCTKNSDCAGPGSRCDTQTKKCVPIPNPLPPAKSTDAKSKDPHKCTGHPTCFALGRGKCNHGSRQCDDSEPKDCSDQKKCGTDEICSNGKCEPECIVDADCKDRRKICRPSGACGSWDRDYERGRWAEGRARKAEALAKTLKSGEQSSAKTVTDIKRLTKKIGELQEMANAESDSCKKTTLDSALVALLAGAHTLDQKSKALLGTTASAATEAEKLAPEIAREVAREEARKRAAAISQHGLPPRKPLNLKFTSKTFISNGGSLNAAPLSRSTGSTRFGGLGGSRKAISGPSFK